MIDSTLAIVIPAYKSLYFEETLASICSQSCKDFTVYIGDDASPNDLKSIADKYSDRINIVYCRFEENLGTRDLVAHWNRCISLCRGETWIWFFSDDDIMEEGCVASFYSALKKSPDSSLFHFNVSVIDEKGDVISRGPYAKKPFPSFMDAHSFIRGRMLFQYNSFAVEYIFRRCAFEQSGGFVNFDLAWGSDDATWLLLARQCGIRTIEGQKVRWRKSSCNITPDRSRDIVKRKILADADCILFIDSIFGDKTLHFYYYLHLLHISFNDVRYVGLKTVFDVFKKMRALR